jgi:Fic family protein
LNFALVRQEKRARDDAATVSSLDGSSSIDQEALNWRQMRILKLMKSRDFIDAEHCQKLFKVSEATARRDLAQLVRVSLLVRLGKGRAIKYIAKD